MKHDGGPAFPGIHIDGDGMREYVPGMTLRDYFAGLAMQSLLIGAETASAMSAVTTDAYWVADAMLRAREKNND